MHARTRMLSLLLATPLIVIFGCGDDGDTSDDSSDATVATANSGDDTPSPDDTLDDTTAPEGADSSSSTSAPSTAAGGGARAAGTCEHLDERPDGIYRIGEAGEVEMRREGDALTVVAVRPAEGWEHRVDDDDDDEVEVEFRSGAREAEFEAEIDDGRLEIEVCTTE